MCALARYVCEAASAAASQENRPRAKPPAARHRRSGRAALLNEMYRGGVVLGVYIKCSLMCLVVELMFCRLPRTSNGPELEVTAVNALDLAHYKRTLQVFVYRKAFTVKL